jgi:hypothetical protein
MADTRIIDCSPDDIEVKRLYLPAKFEIVCPECGSTRTVDAEKQYFGYGTLYLGYCHECDHEWDYQATIVGVKVLLGPAL